MNNICDGINIAEPIDLEFILEYYGGVQERENESVGMC